jgi:hypothetical protein
MPHFPDLLSEDAAHRLLARAVELDAHRAGSLSIEQLRDVACDAGISSRAFEDALVEARAGTPKRSWRSWARHGLLNGLGLVGFFYLFRSLNHFLLPFPDARVLSAIDIVATLTGMAVALRLRGKIAAAVIGAFAAAQLGALPVLYLIFHPELGRPTTLLSSWGWASMGLASVCGVGVGALIMRKRRETPPAAAPHQQANGSPEEAGSDNASSNVKTVRHFPFALAMGIPLTRPDRTPAV